jgi:poly-gamma-glutamate capsule biosynthesis protein CapA/YwtB (metallophosphatase superfamily)
MKLRLLGDINFLGVDDPAVPFRRVKPVLDQADVVVANLECCLYDPPEMRGGVMADDVSGFEGFYAPTKAGEALKLAGIDAIGNANNQNYGAEAILASNCRLDELDVKHAGTGVNKAAARAPVVIEGGGKRVAFLQRTSQYWPNNHEAGERAPGVATMKAYTAYQPPYYKDNKIPPNRPGAPAKVVTWADPDYLAQLKVDVAAAKQNADIVISSHHWGYAEEVLQYQKELAYAAIDAGADVVMGHGPHFPLAIEFYKGKPIFYGLGMFCFIRSNKKAHKGWTGMTGHVTFDGNKVSEVSFSIVRQNDAGEVVFPQAADEAEQIERVARLCKPFGTTLKAEGDSVRVFPPPAQ